MTDKPELQARREVAPWWTLFHDTRERAEECPWCGVRPEDRQPASNGQVGDTR
jgi:hypothetical protein